MNEATDSFQLGAYNIFCNVLSYFSNPDTPVLPLEIPFKGYKERHSSYLWCSPSRNIDCVFLNVATNTNRSEYNLFYTILGIFLLSNCIISSGNCGACVLFCFVAFCVSFWFILR